MIKKCVEVRKKIIQKVKQEMLGPGSEDIGPDIEEEVITDSPIERYSLGILFPQNNMFAQEDEQKYNTNEDDSNNEDKYEENDNKDYQENIHEQVIDDDNCSVIKEKKEYIKCDEVQEQISMANQLLPSAMGLTFFVKGNTEQLKIRVSYAKYRQTKFKDCCVRFEEEFDFSGTGFEYYVYIDKNLIKLKQNLKKSKVFELVSGKKIQEQRPDIVSKLYKLAEQCSIEKYRHCGYVRIPYLKEKVISIDVNNNYSKVFIDKKGQIVDDLGELRLTVLKKLYEDDIYSYTVMLVNENKGEKKYSNSIFQPQIKINSKDNANIRFVEYSNIIKKNAEEISEEDLTFELLYSNKKNYSVGHGVATNQKINLESGEVEIYTDFLPSYEVPQLDFNISEIQEFSEELLSMYNLSDISNISKETKLETLRKFSQAYEKWIEEWNKYSEEIDEVYRNVASKQIEKCRYALKRIEDGINILADNDKVYTAFSLMNRAMLMQRVHSKAKDRFPYDENVPYPQYDYENIKKKDASWRPFQLAFVLMNIQSISDPNCNERDIVELIWVPTGGGKTEAYLGLTGLTIFLRRLNDSKNGGGTTIIMRYTLRLLAAQQFIRASILICACELIRKENKYDLGREEISIGLWVGSAATPNTNKDAKREFKQLTKKVSSQYELKEAKLKHNKFQVLRCPWCGTKLEIEYVKGKKMGEWGYDYDRKKIICCPEQECDFNLKLPIQVVDEEIYKNPPTLLFGTVDKFAALPWKEEVSRLFALDKGNNNKQPELIIQDELHLISGPLGTMVGLYETAVDAMSSYKGIKPKIIASTATIRRASEQCKMLFNREVFQFPPSGIKIEDSFFTKEICVDKKPGRIYIGLMPSGKTSTTAQVRLYTAILQGIKFIDAPDEVLDKYWTLVGYFNSIRELGKSSTLVKDDIASNNFRYMKRLLKSNELRYVNFPNELTSRLDSTEIIKTLKNLENTYSKQDYKNVINVLLATNMISVGVDVPRLDLMVVTGQPKQTAEYIQATSRVGRRYPGIVFTLYNGSKTRDRSHYELFYPYHQTFYKYVEPTSVTPFSEQARERGLHAVFISLVRHILGLNKDKDASKFNENLEGLDKVINIIQKRAENLDNSILQDISSETRHEINDIIFKWDNKVKSLIGDEILHYYKKGEVKNLMGTYLEQNNNIFPTMQSMRNVDGEASIDIIEFGSEKNE